LNDLTVFYSIFWPTVLSSFVYDISSVCRRLSMVTIFLLAAVWPQF